MPEINTAQEKGRQVISLLKQPRYLDGMVYGNGKDMSITTEEGVTEIWEHFVTFPPELARAFPGSYVDPNDFIKEIGYKETEALPLHGLLGKDRGVFEHPVFRYEEEGFGVRIINGTTNSHAIMLATLAFQDQHFSKPETRAQYQEHLFSGIETALAKRTDPQHGIRIHDDCLASGDSIAGYLMRHLKEDSDVLRHGVEVVIDGPATAQGILFLKAFAKAHGIPLHITASFMAFGLSAGEKAGEIRKHANYITCPDELLAFFDVEIQQKLKELHAEDGNIYVVGDMGEAQRGIHGDDMQKIRQKYGDMYCCWNDSRKDSHGDHPNGNTLQRFPYEAGRPDDVYLARGGYLPYEFDRFLNPEFKETNIVIEQAARRWTQEYGYGAAFRKLH